MKSPIANTPPVDWPRPPTAASLGGWGRYFGYDIFISFALGPPPRGCRAYASDLARRLRERGFTVFFSEDEAAVGAGLDDTLRRALHRSRVLVVVANSGTLADPRWVRKEVEEFRRVRPNATVVPISMNGALQDLVLAELTEPWLRFAGRIWIDEKREAEESGQVSDGVIERLVTAPHAVRSLVRLRIAIVLALVTLGMFAAFALVQRSAAFAERDRAQQALLSSAAQQALLLSRDGRAHEGWDALIDTLAMARPAVDGPLPESFFEAALTSLSENRRGPDLRFDELATPPAPREEWDLEPLPFAFHTSGELVAVAVGSKVAVWSTRDGRRLIQADLQVRPEHLTFAAKGTVLVAQGAMPVPPQAPKQTESPMAVALDISSGRVTTLPLTTCEQWIPCISSGKTKKTLLPLTELPSLDQLPRILQSGDNAYLAVAAGEARLEGISVKRFMLLTRGEDRFDRRWLLLDRETGKLLPLAVRIEHADATQFAVASDAPVLVASSESSALIVIYGIEHGDGAPRLIEKRRLHAHQASFTQGVHLDRQGTAVRFQNLRLGTGTGVGIGRTAVVDIGSGRDQWARSEGEVTWSDTLVALREDGGDETHVLSAATGATWFVTPGRPMGFDSTSRTLLMRDMDSSPSKSTWPRVRLLESLPIQRFTRDPRGPASKRSACLNLHSLRFLTLSERFDRTWNRDDWHQRSGVAVSPMTKFPAHGVSPLSERPETQRLWLRPENGLWLIGKHSEDAPISLDRAEAERRYPSLANAIRTGTQFGASLSFSTDGRWTGTVIRPLDNSDKPANEACKGWASWSVHRVGQTVPARTGCMTGERAGPDHMPEIHFLPAKMSADGKLLMTVPTDTCTYQVLEPESGRVHGSVTPVFGNNVSFERVANDLLVVTSTDWYDATVSYQLHAIGSAMQGPVFMLAERNEGDGESEGAIEGRAGTAKTLYAPIPADEEIKRWVDFDTSGRELRLVESGRTTLIGVPPWGELLRERLRRDVAMRTQLRGPEAAR